MNISSVFLDQRCVEYTQLQDILARLHKLEKGSQPKKTAEETASSSKEIEELSRESLSQSQDSLQFFQRDVGRLPKRDWIPVYGRPLAKAREDQLDHGLISPYLTRTHLENQAAYAGRLIGGERNSKDRKMAIFKKRPGSCNGLRL